MATHRTFLIRDVTTQKVVATIRTPPHIKNPHKYIGHIGVEEINDEPDLEKHKKYYEE